MRKLAIALVVALSVLMVTSSASAFSFRFDYAGPVFMKLTGADAGTFYQFPPAQLATTRAAADALAIAWTAPGGVGDEDSWGVFKITSIWTDTLSPQQLWGDGDNGEELTVMFYGLRDMYVDWDSPGRIDSVDASVGNATLDFYLDPAQNYDADQAGLGPLARTGLTSYPTVTDGAPFMRLDVAPGAHSLADEFNTEGLQTLLHANTTTISPFTADGFAFLNVVPGWGTHGHLFDTNRITTFLGTRVDMKMIFDAEPFLDPATGLPVVPTPTTWTTAINDPIRANVIPEPGTLVLLGLGLLSLVAYGGHRRRS
jgi:hypothetical protein